MTRIYTRKGDAGDTSLFDGTRVRKDDLRVAAYGDVDELNAVLGTARCESRQAGLDDVDEELRAVQRDLFALGALMADPRRDGEPAGGAGDPRLDLGPGEVLRLERRIDAWEQEMPALRTFVLPAGSAAACRLHVARCVARRAERAVTARVLRGEARPVAVTYLNRLSDLLFVAARLANHRSGAGDEPW